MHSYRFPDMFPQANLVRGQQFELDALIQKGVMKITRLLKNTEIGQQLAIDDKPNEKKRRNRINIDLGNGSPNDKQHTHSRQYIHAYFAICFFLFLKLLLWLQRIRTERAQERSRAVC